MPNKGLFWLEVIALFEVPIEYTILYDAGYMQGWHLIAWIAIIVMMYVFAVYGLIRAAHAELASQKWFYRAFCWFLIFYGITNITIVLSIWSNAGNDYNFYQGIANFSGVVSLFPLILTFEKYLVSKTHFVFTIIGIVVVILVGLVYVLMPNNPTVSLRIAQVGAPILLVIVVALFFVLISQSAGEVRKRAIYTLLGIAFAGFGAIFNGVDMIGLGVPLYVAPILFGLGILLIVWSQMTGTASKSS
jgi:hypothetical protein